MAEQGPCYTETSPHSLLALVNVYGPYLSIRTSSCAPKNRQGTWSGKEGSIPAPRAEALWGQGPAPHPALPETPLQVAPGDWPTSWMSEPQPFFFKCLPHLPPGSPEQPTLCPMAEGHRPTGVKVQPKAWLLSLKTVVYFLFGHMPHSGLQQ